ncbi:uncharacterized protein LOC135200057 isoform X2 [Macrobrachium nipponense]|uniref:uncharacterized protein LOC135200057 isoform X2 n=1 Tax=Macrobrachium nipponense TaxID=159736 RepID=UPI0030C887F3
MTASAIHRSSWVLFLLLYQSIRISGQGHLCNASLGLGDSRIPNAAITSSVNNSKPAEARLNGKGAWCFKHSETKGLARVSITIDLGRTALVSGLQTQGPPKDLAVGSYFIGFGIRSSITADQQDWTTCCGGGNVTFYAQTQDGKSDVISTHSFTSLVAARRLRLEFDSSVKWPGEDNKCFRFEIIGCPQNVTPITGLIVEALPAGWVVATWEEPMVRSPGGRDLTLGSTSYLAAITRKGGGEENQVQEMKVNARRLTVPSPLWGATYTISLKCVYQGFNLSCGNDTIDAEVTGCDPKESTCLIQNQVVFRRPLWLQAAVVGEEKVELTWSSASNGWITSEVILRVVDNDLEEIDTLSLSNTEEKVTVTGVTGGNNYSVTFIPTANSLELAMFSFNLYILAWDGVRLSTKEIGYGAFVTDVSLSAAILWDGTLRVTWTPALVLGVSWEEDESSPPVTSSTRPVSSTGSTGSTVFKGSTGSTVSTGSTGSTRVTATTISVGTTGSTRSTISTAFTGSTASTNSTGSTPSAISTGSTLSANSTAFTGSTASTNSTGSTASTISTGSTLSANSTAFTGSTASTNSTGSTASTISTRSTLSANSTAFMVSTASTNSTASTASINSTGSMGTTPSINSTGSVGTTASISSTGYTGSTASTNSTGSTGSTGSMTSLRSTTPVPTTTAGSTNTATASTNTASSTLSSGVSSSSTARSTTYLANNKSMSSLSSTTPSPTPVESSQATAFMYTIYLSSSEEERYENVTDISGDVISIDLPSLSFETQYTVTLTCHFGEVSVECGDTNIYAALPIHWIVMEDDIIIHAPAQGLGSWQDQEDQCRTSAGTLVSLADTLENDRLQESLTKKSSTPTMDTFWIGLNMCPEHQGFPWSDGSMWQQSNLPNENSMLSSTTCCIKAVWNQVEKKFSWLGEECDALLPAICEFHPEGMVAKAEVFHRGSANKTEASVSWSFEPKYWNASSLVIEYCPVRSLMNIGSTVPVKEDLGNCTTSIVDPSVTTFVQADLIPFTEYNVSITARIDALNFTGQPSVTYVRTHAETPVIVRTLPSGRLHVMWAEKVAEFDEGDNVKMEVMNSSNPAVAIFSKSVPVTGGTIDGLLLGASYTVTLEEFRRKKRKENVTITAYPACPCDDCQIGGFCYGVQEKQSDGFTADQKCRKDDSRLVIIDDVSQVDRLLEVAEVLRDDLWVDPSSKKISATALNSRGTAALLTEDNEVEVIDEESATTDKTTKECLIVSRARRAVIVEACSILHKPACRQKAPVASAFPPVNEIRSDSGGDWISLDWTMDWGWKAKYFVYYQRRYDKIYKRSLRKQEFAYPPVMVSGLEPNGTYTMELVADLGGGFVSTSGEFDLSTSSDMTKATTDKLTIGSVPVGQDYIMPLVCGSILVAACITTMLLFFATGMFYQDCVAQLAFLGTLIAAFLNLMLAHPNPVLPENETGCIVVAVVLHFLFLCAFMFLMLESLTYAHLLVTPIRSPFQKSNWLLIAFGLIVPLIVVAICAAVPYRKYVDYDQSNCWLNGTGDGVYGEAIPIAILIIASLILLILTMFNNETPPELIDINLRSRQSDSHKLRWVVMALVIELTVVWGTGISTYQTGSSGLRTVFCIFTLILAITIVGARTSFDDTFRSKMHRLCCGTALTYKRSELAGLSGKSRVAPVSTRIPPDSAVTASSSQPKNYATKEERTTTVIPSAEETTALPNTPPMKEDQKHVLIRRSYHFSDDGPVNYFE